MSYVTVVDGANGTVTRNSVVYRLIERGWPQTAAGETEGRAHATATAGVSFYVDGADKAIAVSGRIRGGRWFNSSTSIVDESFEEATTAQKRDALLLDRIRHQRDSIASFARSAGEVDLAKGFLAKLLAYRDAGNKANLTHATGWPYLDAGSQVDIPQLMTAANTEGTGSTSWVPVFQYPSTGADADAAKWFVVPLNYQSAARNSVNRPTAEGDDNWASVPDLAALRAIDVWAL